MNFLFHFGFAACSRRRFKYTENKRVARACWGGGAGLPLGSRDRLKDINKWTLELCLGSWCLTI